MLLPLMRPLASDFLHAATPPGTKEIVERIVRQPRDVYMKIIKSEANGRSSGEMLMPA